MSLKFLLFVVTAAGALAGDVSQRDAAGNVVSTTTATGTGSEVIRGAHGQIVGTRDIHKNADGSESVTIRDAAGNITGRETRGQMR